jgi:shikimate kinase
LQEKMDFSGRIIVLVGLMGAGKTRIGAELAKLVNLPFFDADREIEHAAGMPIPDIFEKLGEAAFRAGEKKVMLRLLSEKGRIIAPGGGAFIQQDIREAIKKSAISVWLKADLPTLLERVSRTDHRPLLRVADPAAKLRELMEARYPIYAEADITVISDRQTPQEMAQRIVKEIGKLT